MHSWMETGRSKAWPLTQPYANDNDLIACDWQSVRSQLLTQWSRLNTSEIDATGASRHAIAKLVSHKYGIDAELVENYLLNLERTLPLEGGLHVC